MSEFPGGPVVRTRCFHCWGPGSVSGQGAKILQATEHGQKKKKTDIIAAPWGLQLSELKDIKSSSKKYVITNVLSV